jgi:outer membrane receptor protein involved in Fe transport
MKNTLLRSGPIPLALLCAVLCGPAVAPLGAQAGTGVAGQVLNGLTGQPVPGATLTVEGAGDTAPTGSSDLTGGYRITVPAGTYTLRVEKAGFETERVTGVAVASGQMANVAVVLMPGDGATPAGGIEGDTEAATFAEGITVESTAAESSEEALLVERKQAAQISDAIGREEIGQTTGSDAAGVLKRVTGVSIQEDKFVYVRGLGDRYSNTTLNGSKIPSTEFEKRVVPLNLFPTSLLEKISVSKSYTVDKPGDFAAGFVDLRTLEFPANQNVSVGISASHNSITTGEPILEYDGGLSFTGGGGQSLPSSIPGEEIFPSTPFSPDGYSREEIEAFGEDLIGSWSPQGGGSAPYDQSYKLSYGNTFGDFGLVLSANHENDYEVRDEEQAVFGLSGGELIPQNTYRILYGEETVRQSLLGSLAWRVSDNSHLKLRTLYTNLSNAEGRDLNGFFDDLNTNVQDNRVSYMDQEIVNLQVSGEHYLPGAFASGSLFEWRASGTEAVTEENRRETIYEQRRDGDYYLTDFGQSGFMYFNDLEDTLTDGGADWTTFLSAGRIHGSVKAGAAYTRNEREFDGRRLRYDHRSTFGVDLRDSPEDLFTQETIGTAFILQEITRPTDAYDGDHEVLGGYVQTDLSPSWMGGRWRLIAGVRVEQSDLEVTTVDRADPTAPPDVTLLDDSDVLPAFNLVYQLNGDTNLRFAASQTVNRPEFRELAPFSYIHVVGGFEVTGNPELQSATIRSYDVRWEWFPEGGEVVAASLFYKDFEDPIESIQLAGAQQLLTYTNAMGARNYGAELELRRELGSLWAGLRDVSAVVNYTYVDSQIEIDPNESALSLTNPDHPLTGQPEQLGNVGLEWRQPEWGSALRLLYNHVGEKLFTGGTFGLPDVYEEARDTFDLIWSQELAFVAPGLGVKLSGTNLTDEERLWTQGGGTYRRYEPGRTFGLSLSYEPF